MADLKRVELVVKRHLLHDPVVGYQLAAGRYPRERVYQVCVPEGVHVYLVRALGVARRVPVLRPRLVVPHVDRVGRRGTVGGHGRVLLEGEVPVAVRRPPGAASVVVNLDEILAQAARLVRELFRDLHRGTAREVGEALLAARAAVCLTGGTRDGARAIGVSPRLAAVVLDRLEPPPHVAATVRVAHRV